MNSTMTIERGYQSALSACPAPVAAAFAAPSEARLRAVAIGNRLGLGAVVPFQGTALPIASRSVADVPSMTLVQPHPGDTARRPPA